MHDCVVLRYNKPTEMYKTIETERLLIRPIEITDAEFITTLVNSLGWLQYIGDRNISNTIDAEKYIQKILDNPNFYYSVFELKSSHKAIGIVTFLNRENQDYPDLGFALLPDFEKNGYTYEASKKYLDEVVKLNRYDTITAITMPENKKSISLLLKLGLEYVFDYKGDSGILSVYRLMPDEACR